MGLDASIDTHGALTTSYPISPSTCVGEGEESGDKFKREALEHSSTLPSIWVKITAFLSGFRGALVLVATAPTYARHSKHLEKIFLENTREKRIGSGPKTLSFGPSPLRELTNPPRESMFLARFYGKSPTNRSLSNTDSLCAKR